MSISSTISASVSWTGISRPSRLAGTAGLGRPFLPFFLRYDLIKRAAMTLLDQNARNHTNSYYAASQRDKVPFPALEGEVQVDVCIVGGGLTGVATAVELSERGYKVALLEANRIGWGASGRNGGQIIGGYGEALSSSPRKTARKFGDGALRMVDAMGQECVSIIRDRVAKYDIACDLQWGYLDVALSQHDLRSFEATLAENAARETPYEMRLVPANGMGEFLGTDRYIGGLVNEGYGHLHVLDLCKGEARAAEGLGAQIFEQSLVTSIQHGQKVSVSTENGRVTADYAVLCGNAYLAQFAPEVAPKLSKYVLPASSYVIATEPLGDELAHSVMAKNYAVCDQRTALDYFRLSADKRMLFGGLCNYSARDPRSVTGTMGAKMRKIFPQLADVAIDYHWGGFMGIGLNRIPQLGRLANNVYYAQAYSGHGVAPTHMSGRLLAEAISAQAERFDVMAKVRHTPFPGGRFLRQSLFALGMLAYKIRDELR